MNILITGGSSGLGRSAVELLSQNKENTIWFTYVDQVNYQKFISELENKYDNFLGFEVDFCDLQSVETFCVKLRDIDLDVLINNAYVGVPRSKHFHKLEVEEFLKSFENNLLPTIKITQAAIEIFKKKKFGKIINILTEYLVGLPPMGIATYSANKAYLQQLSKVWNKEYSKFNITSNCVLPAYMQTKFAEVDERIVEQMTQDHPLKRLLSTKEVAETIQFLVNSSQQINGINITINAAQNL